MSLLLHLRNRDPGFAKASPDTGAQLARHSLESVVGGPNAVVLILAFQFIAVCIKRISLQSSPRASRSFSVGWDSQSPKFAKQT